MSPQRSLLGASFLLALACGGHSAAPSTTPAPVATPTVAPARPAAPATIRYGPSALRYLIRREVSATQTFQGQTSASRLGFRLFVHATIRGPADSGGYPTTITIDSIIPDSGIALPVTLNLAATRGLSYSGILSPHGEFKNATPSDTTIARGLAQVLANFREFYPSIPGGGLALNAAWTDTTSRTDRAGIFDRVTVTAITTSRASAIEERAGAHAVRVEVSAILAITGAGNQAGQALDLAGRGTRHGVEYVAVDGRFLGGESVDSTDLEIAVPAQGQVVQIRQVARFIVQVLP
jgi:hypothetical protein